jgi:hypothetical protein
MRTDPNVRQPGVVKKTKMYYENYVRSDSQITFVTNISAEHAWITDK